MALTIPFTFTAGTPAKASEVNANFTAIAAWGNSGSFTTDSFGILYPRTIPLLSTPFNPILRLEQSTGDQALYIRNTGTGESIELVQAAPLGAGKSSFLMTDSQTQSAIGAAKFKMELGANVNIPAIHIVHNSVDIFKVNQNGVKPPVKTTVQRNAIVSPETGSILYDSTAEQVSVKRSDGWTPIGPPVGSVQMFAGSATPEGWLLCNGNTLNSVANPQYAALFAIIGTTYGGTGPSSFMIPNCQGIFVRGAGAQTIGAETYSATLGNKQNDATAVNGLSTVTGGAHSHNLTIHSAGGTPPERVHGGGIASTFPNPDTTSIQTAGAHTHGLTGDTETRPANIAMNYIIKY